MHGFTESQNMLGEITLTYNNSIPPEARILVFDINGQQKLFLIFKMIKSRILM